VLVSALCLSSRGVASAGRSGSTDAELISRLEHLVKADRTLEVKLLVHLGELDERKLYLERGYRSIYEYCRSALRMSDGEAYLRIKAAEVGRRFPLVLERLEAGAVHLSGIKLLARFLTADNHVMLLDRILGWSKRQIEVLVAELEPKSDVPARLRKLPARRVAIQSPLLVPATEVPSSTHASLPLSAATPPWTAAQQIALAPEAAPALTIFALQSPQPRASTKPLSPGRFKLEVTLGQETHDQLERLQELLRHQNPSGDLASIIERAVSQLFEREMKRRFAQTKEPKQRVAREPDRSGACDKALKQRVAGEPGRSGTGDNAQRLCIAAEPGRSGTGDNAQRLCVAAEPARSGTGDDSEREAEVASAGELAKMSSRYVPREVVREVYARDAGQCTFTSPDGRRCTARGFLEVHHHGTTFARGGAATAENLRLACRAHNIFFLAEREYGRGWMQRKLQAAVAQRTRSGKVAEPSLRAEATRPPLGARGATRSPMQRAEPDAAMSGRG
jgi:hypothetical protein